MSISVVTRVDFCKEFDRAYRCGFQSPNPILKIIESYSQYLEQTPISPLRICHSLASSISREPHKRCLNWGTRLALRAFPSSSEVSR